VARSAEIQRNDCTDIQREIKYMDYYGVTSTAAGVMRCTEQWMSDDAEKVFTTCQSCSLGVPVKGKLP
jgi:hypothetical protein